MSKKEEAWKGINKRTGKEVELPAKAFKGLIDKDKLSSPSTRSTGEEPQDYSA